MGDCGGSIEGIMAEGARENVGRLDDNAQGDGKGEMVGYAERVCEALCQSFPLLA